MEPAKTAKPPKWLPEWMKKDFRTLGKRLIAAGLYTDLDNAELQEKVTILSDTVKDKVQKEEEREAQ